MHFKFNSYAFKVNSEAFLIPFNDNDEKILLRNILECYFCEDLLGEFGAFALEVSENLIRKVILSFQPYAGSIPMEK